MTEDRVLLYIFVFFFQAEDGIRDYDVTGVQTCALPIFIIFSYVSFRVEWNYFMFIQMIQFFQFIDLSLEYWVFLDRYVFNGAL